MSWGNDNNACCVPLSRCGLLAYVYNGVSLTTSTEVAGNGSYIVRPCGHDLHGPTVRTQPVKRPVSFNIVSMMMVTLTGKRGRGKGGCPCPGWKEGREGTCPGQGEGTPVLTIGEGGYPYPGLRYHPPPPGDRHTPV